MFDAIYSIVKFQVSILVLVPMLIIDFRAFTTIIIIIIYLLKTVVYGVNDILLVLLVCLNLKYIHRKKIIV